MGSFTANATRKPLNTSDDGTMRSVRSLWMSAVMSNVRSPAGNEK